MLRIAFVTPIFPTPREAFRGTYNFKLVESLQKKADIEVFCPMATLPPRIRAPQTVSYTSDEMGPGAPAVRATYIPYPSIRLVTRPLNGIVSGWKLLPHLEKHRPDLVFAPWIHQEGYGALRVCQRLGLPIVVEALGSDLRRIADPVSRHLVRKTVTSADAVITVSRELKKWAVAFGARPENVFPVLNGCDAAVFHPRDRAAARRKLQVEPDAELALFVGSLIPSKGVRELVEAAAALFPRRPRFRLAMIGAGALREWLRDRAHASPYRDRFQVLGARSPWEIADWLGAANLLCLPSYSEGCPNVVVEALSSGRPVVASRVGGIPELVDESTGILIPPASAGALAAALEAALERSWDEEGIHRTAGRSWDQAADETLRVCEETYDRVKRRKVHAAPAEIPPARAHTAGERLRIAVVTAFFPSVDDPHHGLAILETVKALAQLADVRVICPAPVSVVKSQATALGRILRPDNVPENLCPVYVRYSTVPVIGRPFNGRRAAAKIRDEVARFRPDVILSYWIYPDGYGAVTVAGELGIPAVIGSRGSDLRRPGQVSSWLSRHAIRNAAAVLTVSDDLRRYALEAGASPDRVFTILNGVDTGRFRLRDQAAARASLGVGPGKRLVLFVGRLSVAKGVRELLKGCGAVFDRRPDAELALIGAGALAASAERFAAAYPGRVRLLNACGREEVAAWMAASDMLCLPSYSEGCPNVVIESLASGRPVVATAEGGVPEILQPGCGILIQARSAAEVERGLEEALGREWDFSAIASSWNRGWAKVAEETFQICESLVSRARGAAR